MTFYKVVVISMGGRLESAARGLPESYRTYYSVGDWTFPVVEGTKLFVFGTLNSALVFAEGFLSHTQVWECEVENHSEIKIIAGCGYAPEYWAAFRNKTLISSDVYSYHLDEGKIIPPSVYQYPDSYLVDSVKLTKLVKEYREESNLFFSDDFDN